jgi:hypothetical protein
MEGEGARKICSDGNISAKIDLRRRGRKSDIHE